MTVECFFGTRHKRFQWVILAIIIVCSAFTPTVTRAQGIEVNSHLGEVCFAVADERDVGGVDNQDDTLTILETNTAQSDVIGPTGTRDIETITFGPGHQLYGSDSGFLGTINLTTGNFTRLSQPLGTAGGSFGEIALNNIDALAYSLDLGIMFGTQRREGTAVDLLFAANPFTGAHIPEYFGPSGGPKTDYVPVTPILDENNDPLTDVDDMQFNPTTGQLFAAMNTGGQGGSLVVLDIATGNTTLIARLRFAQGGAIIDDVEGLSFDNQGLMYASTGDNFSGAPDNRNRLFRLDPATGLGELIGPFPTGFHDYESLACLSAEAAIVLKKYTNGPGQLPDDADTPTGPSIDAGAVVTWTYVMTNTGVLTLTELSLLDDELGDIGGPGHATCLPTGTTLAPGKSLTCTVTGIAEPGQYSNVGTISGKTTGVTFPTETVTDTDPSHYFGVAQEPAALGDKVWDDLNKNGVQDAGEPGVPGVTVTLFDSSNVQVGAPQSTNADGIYLFTDLEPGSYYVIFAPATLPAGYTFTSANQGLDNADSDADLAGKTPSVTLAAGQTYRDLDAGVIAPPVVVPPPASLGDRVWVDNGNGVQDAGEANVPGATVTLYSCSDTLATTPLATDVTDANGLYLFENLAAGCYYVIFTLPPAYAGYTFTTPNSGADNTLDSDADSTGKSEQITLVPGDVNTTLDAGIVAPPVVVVPPASLGDRVWEDDDDGVQEPGEPSVPGVTVTLYACTDTLATTPLATDVTDENGLYLFDNLVPGCYYIIITLPEAYAEFSPQNVGDNAQDSDADATGRSEEVTLGPGIDYRDLDGGVVSPVDVIVEPPNDPTGLPEVDQPKDQEQIFLPTLRH